MTKAQETPIKTSSEESPQVNGSHHVITSYLNDEEYDLWQTFISEQHITDPLRAVSILLREYDRVLDALWDEKLARPSPALDALMAQVQADADAGLTLDLTPDMLDDEI